MSTLRGEEEAMLESSEQMSKEASRLDEYQYDHSLSQKQKTLPVSKLRIVSDDQKTLPVSKLRIVSDDSACIDNTENEQQALQCLQLLQFYNALFCSLLVDYYCAESVDETKSYLFVGVLTEFLKMVGNCTLFRQVFCVLGRPDRDSCLKRVLTVELWERVDRYVEDFLKYKYFTKSHAAVIPTMFTASDLPLLTRGASSHHINSVLEAKAPPQVSDVVETRNTAPSDDRFASMQVAKQALDTVPLRVVSIQKNGSSSALAMAIQTHPHDSSKDGTTTSPKEANVTTMEYSTVAPNDSRDVLQPPSIDAFQDDTTKNPASHAFHVSMLPSSLESKEQVPKTSSQLLLSQMGETGAGTKQQDDAVLVATDDGTALSTDGSSLLDQHGSSAKTWDVNNAVLATMAQKSALQSDPSKKKRKRLPKMSTGYNYLEGEPLENDVKYGRGGGTNNHKGNITYLLEKLKLQAGYTLLATQKGKKIISQQLVDIVHKRGGRFVAKDEETGRWYVVDDGIARKKASQTLREDKTPYEQTMKRKCLLSKLDEMTTPKKLKSFTLSLQEQKASQTLLELNSMGREANWKVPVEQAENLLLLASESHSESADD